MTIGIVRVSADNHVTDINFKRIVRGAQVLDEAFLAPPRSELGNQSILS